MIADYIKTAPQYILPKQSLTILAGLLANVKAPAVKDYLIQNFIKKYGLNMQEALQEDPTRFVNFNDFFIRHLKSECRPLSSAEIVSPVDGSISEIGSIHQGTLLQAKGRYYSVHELLACEQDISAQFSQGRFATLYLSPKDYHRIHMPLDACVQQMIYVPGKLFSVQPTTVRVVRQLFARNERLVVLMETQIGLMAMVLVGATIVGGIGTSWHGDVARSRQQSHYVYSQETSKITLKKGEEMGYFKLGSTVVLLFAEGKKMNWASNLTAGQTIRFGQTFGNFL